MITKEISKYLNQFADNYELVEKILITSFLKINNIEDVKNALINKFVLEDKSEKEFLKLYKNNSSSFTLEDLVSLFEIIIPKKDKIVNGAVYTPEYIKDFIIYSSFNKILNTSSNIRTGDISCGCGGFLLNLAKFIKKNTKNPYWKIYDDNIFGIDITDYNIERAKILLTLQAIIDNEDQQDFNFNIFIGNSLSLALLH